MAASADVRGGNTRVAITDDDVTENNSRSTMDIDDFVIIDGWARVR